MGVICDPDPDPALRADLPLPGGGDSRIGRRMDLADLIDRNAAFAPDKPAIRFGGATLTYSQFARRIAAASQPLSTVERKTRTWWSDPGQVFRRSPVQGSSLL